MGSSRVNKKQKTKTKESEKSWSVFEASFKTQEKNREKETRRVSRLFYRKVDDEHAVNAATHKAHVQLPAQLPVIGGWHQRRTQTLLFAVVRDDNVVVAFVAFGFSGHGDRDGPAVGTAYVFRPVCERKPTREKPKKKTQGDQMGASV